MANLIVRDRTKLEQPIFHFFPKERERGFGNLNKKTKKDLLVVETSRNSNNADQMVDGIVHTDSILKQAAYDIIYEIRKGNC